MENKAKRKDVFRVKVYVVLRGGNVPASGKNPEILAVKLTHRAAQSFVDKYPGSFTQMFLADKEFINSQLTTSKE